jgi:hypothetical protein
MTISIFSSDGHHPIPRKATLYWLYIQPKSLTTVKIMNKQISSILLATSLFTLNAVPAQAAQKNANLNQVNAQKQLVATPGQWCFELPWMGLCCYDF